MNKTVYLRDEEVPLWERARELSGDKLSPVIVAALREFAARAEAEAKGYERIVVQYEDSKERDKPKAKAFYGKWLIPPDESLGFTPPGHSHRSCYAVAITGKAGVVVVRWRVHNNSKIKDAEQFSVYSNIDDALSDGEVNWAVRVAITRQGVPVEELDI